jgi:hypothetical protein
VERLGRLDANRAADAPDAKKVRIELRGAGAAPRAIGEQ